jgi:hypothetical protein
MTDEDHWHVDGEFRLNGGGLSVQNFEVSGFAASAAALRSLPSYGQDDQSIDGAVLSPEPRLAVEGR